MAQPFHTVYCSYESIRNGRDYIGKHSTENPYDDYMGTYKDAGFCPDSKVVLGYAKTAEGAIWLEMQYQRVFGVAEDAQYANQSYQTSEKFLFSGKGELNPFYGLTHTEKSRRVMREKRLGKPSNFRGKRHTEEAIQKNKKKQENKPVRCVETGACYSSGWEAHRETGINAGNIRQCAAGKRKVAGGLHWEYLNYTDNLN